ncbi:hypothetical protein C1646_743705 [Rhizophagus diaphanus]|nr:hypothetical protein C1646_743705 [Rhizophagus diaphanus] [Rhizophagus sp. MUCL 43196]
MSKNITLSCLIQGTSLDKYFKITIDKNSDISDLKETIWNKNKNTFSSIDANSLILWKVRIPISDKEKFKQLNFNESTIEGDLSGTKIDDATDEVKDVFGNSPIGKHIHIIIGQSTTENPTITTHALNQETQSLAQQTGAMYSKEESNERNGRSLFSDNIFFNRETSDISKNDQPDKKNSCEYITNTRSSHNNSSPSDFRLDLNYDETNPFGFSLFDQNRQNNEINNRAGFNLSGQSPCACKILLLGGTGTGKSTIINMMANYFLGGTLENPKVVIPTKYFKVTENAFGRNDTEAKVGDVTRSQTTKCCNYEFKHPENTSCNFVFIDTPGMSDTNGIEQDDKNIQEIINTAIDAGSLTAIIIIASDCQLEFNCEDGSNNFIGCSCMGQDGKCRVCGCGPSSHYHDNTEMVTETKTIEKVLEDIKAKYDLADENHKRISNHATRFQESFANLQDQADANYDKILQLCTDLSKICSRFNFVDELHANIENMRMDARNIQSIDIRTKAESDIRNLETFINGLSNKIV